MEDIGVSVISEHTVVITELTVPHCLPVDMVGEKRGESRGVSNILTECLSDLRSNRVLRPLVLPLEQVCERYNVPDVGQLSEEQFKQARAWLTKMKKAKVARPKKMRGTK